jgi:hypothetical protein
LQNTKSRFFKKCSEEKEQSNKTVANASGDKITFLKNCSKVKKNSAIKV